MTRSALQSSLVQVANLLPVVCVRRPRGALNLQARPWRRSFEPGCLEHTKPSAVAPVTSGLLGLELPVKVHGAHQPNCGVVRSSDARPYYGGLHRLFRVSWTAGSRRSLWNTANGKPWELLTHSLPFVPDLLQVSWFRYPHSNFKAKGKSTDRVEWGPLCLAGLQRNIDRKQERDAESKCNRPASSALALSSVHLPCMDSINTG